jgi:salicylate 5-hydroxylase large subunit
MIPAIPLPLRRMNAPEHITEAPVRVWPKEGVARIPYWAYTDPAIYAREQERIFCGRSWNYVCLAAEIANPGDFKRTFIGEKPVVVTREQDGSIHCFENRCAHRGVQFCQKHLGNATEFMCPYHQWTYNLSGDLIGVPFLRGVKKQGGMPADFKRENHGLRKLKVAERNGAVFASFADDVEDFETYVGPSMLPLYDRVFDGRELEVLGYQRQLIPANWKLMFENIKDPYHATLLHVFLVSFGLFRADQPSSVRMDATGRHGALISWKAAVAAEGEVQDMKSFQQLKLRDTTMLQPEREFPEFTVVMTTLWPNIIIQQQSNTLAMRQLITRGPEAFELAWTYFGYKGEPEEMRLKRLRQANLMGPSGYVSMDDSEVMKFSQDGIRPYTQYDGVMEMGGRDWKDEPHMVTEGVIRGFYDYYRSVMDL